MVLVLLLTASCYSPPIDVVLVVVVVVLQAVEADARVIVDAKIIVSVKIVATRWMLRSSSGIFPLRLFSIPILRNSRRETRIKEFYHNTKMS